MCVQSMADHWVTHRFIEPIHDYWVFLAPFGIILYRKKSINGVIMNKSLMEGMLLLTKKQ